MEDGHQAADEVMLHRGINSMHARFKYLRAEVDFRKEWR